METYILAMTIGLSEVLHLWSNLFRHVFCTHQHCTRACVSKMVNRNSSRQIKIETYIHTNKTYIYKVYMYFPINRSHSLICHIIIHANEYHAYILFFPPGQFSIVIIHSYVLSKMLMSASISHNSNAIISTSCI